MARLAAWLLAVVVLLTACGGGDRHRDPAADTAAITAALQKFPPDFNARDYPALCGLFAEDVVLNYPGLTAERGRDAFCARMRKTLSTPTGSSATPHRRSGRCSSTVTWPPSRSPGR